MSVFDALMSCLGGGPLRRPKRTTDHASSAETSDQLGQKLGTRRTGGRSIGAFQSRASLRRSDDGRHRASGRVGDRHLARPY
jgi:hypothetical protein